ncbi:MAG TPA: FmdB family transcriptional regulator [Acidimicrobiaceae bacterium]|nr:FmdB family transcriptional regulator [Acidimicrobiaceae bacterium]
MPTYDYRCNDCGETFEIWQSFSEDALTECPTCEGELKKVYSKVGISFKGDGFYKNDHGYSSEGSSSSSSSSDSGSSSDSSNSSDSSSSDSSSSSSSSGD